MFKQLEPFIENFLLYGENVSYFYIFCLAVSFIAVGLSWRIEQAESTEEKTEENINADLGEQFDKNENAYSNDNLKDMAENGTASELVDKKSLLDHVAQNLSHVDLEQEKEIEKQQLASIFELIKKDQNKFQIGTLQELEEQMKLYRE